MCEICLQCVTSMLPKKHCERLIFTLPVYTCMNLFQLPVYIWSGLYCHLPFHFSSSCGFAMSSEAVMWVQYSSFFQKPACTETICKFPKFANVVLVFLFGRASHKSFFFFFVTSTNSGAGWKHQLECDITNIFIVFIVYFLNKVSTNPIVC